MNDVRGATGIGGVDIAHVAQAEVVEHVVGAQARGVTGAQVAVNVGHGQAGVGECATRAFGVQLGDGLVGRLASRMLVGAHDAGLAT